jgi:hypothetical protein
LIESIWNLLIHKNKNKKEGGGKGLSGRGATTRINGTPLAEYER